MTEIVVGKVYRGGIVGARKQVVSDPGGVCISTMSLGDINQHGSSGHVEWTGRSTFKRWVKTWEKKQKQA